MSYKTFVDVHKVDYDRAANRCNDFYEKNNPCTSGTHGAEWTEGRSGKDRCSSLCSDTVSGIPGELKNPCLGPVKAYNRHFITNSSHSSIGDVGLACEWYIVDSDLRTMSSDPRYTNATITNTNNQKISLYEQLLFGVQSGPENTKGEGFCDNVSLLTKEVHSDGSTCYDMIKTKISEAEAMRKGRLLCDSQPQLEQCKCINISQPDGVNYCLRNRTLPGCDKVVQSYESIPARARTQFNLQNQSTGCYNGTACTGEVFRPEVLPQVCNNTIAVCDQQIKIGDITGGTVQIEQLMDCQATSETTTGGGGGAPTGGSGGGVDDDDDDGETEDEDIKFPKNLEELKTFFPKNLEELKTSKKKQIGVGGVVSMFVIILACILILVVAMS